MLVGSEALGGNRIRSEKSGNNHRKGGEKMTVTYSINGLAMTKEEIMAVNLCSDIINEAVHSARKRTKDSAAA